MRKKLPILLLAAAALGAIPIYQLPSHAATVYWAGSDPATNGWFSTMNWSNRSAYPYPGPGDSPRIGGRLNEIPYQLSWPHYNGTNTLVCDGNFAIGTATNAWFFMESGLLQINSQTQIGLGNGWTGNWVQTGGTYDISSLGGKFFTVGGQQANSPATFTMSGGVIRCSNFGMARFFPASLCWAVVSGNAELYANSVMFIGIWGSTATLTNKDNALISINGSLTIGRNEGGSGKVYQEGGTISAGTSSDVGVHLFTNSIYTLSGGTLLTSFVQGSSNEYGGTLIFDGGTLKSKGISQRLVRGMDTMSVNSGKSAIIDTAGFYSRVLQPLTGSGGLTKVGQGTLVLERVNTFTGPTLVSEGTLICADVASSMGTVSVASGAGFGANIPASVGKLSVSSMNLSNTSSLNMTVRAADAGSADARIETAALDLTGSVSVNVTPADMLAPGTYPLLKWTSKSGTGSLVPGLVSCSYDADVSVVGNQLNLVVFGPKLSTVDLDPVSQAVVQNRPVTFTAAAGCTENATYQWLFNDSAILDATNTSYTIEQTLLSQAGNYEFVVSNPAGSVTSAVAVLTVTADTVAPKLSWAAAYTNSAGIVRAAFDEGMDPTSAQTGGNYVLTNRTSGGAAVSPASASYSNGIVTLTFASPLADGQVYTLSAPGVTDLAGVASTGSVIVKLFGIPTPSVAANRLTVLEAESADVFQNSSVYDSTDRNWEIVTDRTGYSGWAAIQCLPNVGHSGNPISEGPGARYYVEFPASDTYPVDYYLWIRGAAQASADDSCHASLNWPWPGILGVYVTVTNMTQNLYQPGGGWGWVNRSENSGTPRARFTVPSAGVHSVDILMREDGLYVDKLVLTTDSAYNPSTINGGLGPTSETRASYPSDIAILPGSLGYSGTTFTMQVQTVPTVDNIIEYKDSLDDPNWTVLTSFVGNGAIQTKSDTSASGNARFYRARINIP